MEIRQRQGPRSNAQRANPQEATPRNAVAISLAASEDRESVIFGGNDLIQDREVHHVHVALGGHLLERKGLLHAADVQSVIERMKQLGYLEKDLDASALVFAR